MALLVQKYGGTSVTTPEHIGHVADRVAAARQLGHQVVVVVSAMGEETERLHALAQATNPVPQPRELDVLLATGEQATIALLAMALERRGCPARSFTGAQAGIRTDTKHNRARIESIDPGPVRKALAEEQVAVVAGFQGVDAHGNITTIGRGGSDTTAVAMAAAIGADECQICTDVDGVYTADPRIVGAARRLDRVSMEEMLELSGMGSRVLHPRAVECAGRHRVPVRVVSTFMSGDGTLVGYQENEMEGPQLAGIACSRDEAMITVSGIPDQPGIGAALLGPLVDSSIEVDMVVQNQGQDGRMDLSFTVHRGDHDRALRRLRQTADELNARTVSANDQIAKISVVGAGVRRSHAGVVSKLCQVLAGEGIDIRMLSTAEIKVSVAVDEKYLELAVRALHDAFQLDRAEDTGSEDRHADADTKSAV